MTLPELAIFDITGTLIRDSGAVTEAFVAALAEEGVELSPQSLEPWRGASKRRAIRGLLEGGAARIAADDYVERIHARFCQRLRESWARDGIGMVAGADAAWAWLRSRGVRLAFNTGFDRALACLVAEALAAKGVCADAAVCGEDVQQGRPAPYMIFRAMEATGAIDVRRVAVVGDTALDLEAGQNAGVGQVIGVLSGAHNSQRLQKAPHTAILPSVAALPELWNCPPAH